MGLGHETGCLLFGNQLRCVGFRDRPRLGGNDGALPSDGIRDEVEKESAEYLIDPDFDSDFDPDEKYSQEACLN